MPISPHHKVDRSRANESQVQIAQIPKSGFNKSYKTFTTLTMGRLHVGGYHHVMPADKFRGSNQASLTFFRLNQPNISDVNISQHNFFVTFRCLDTTFEDAFAPNLNNSMSLNWSAPSFSLDKLALEVLNHFSASAKTSLESFLSTATSAPSTAITSTNLSALQSIYSNQATLINPLINEFKNLYFSDWVTDVYAPRLRALLSTISTTTTNRQAYLLFIDAVLFPFLGEGSLLDELGYIYMRRSDLDNTPNATTFLSLSSCFSSLQQNEYPIRAYYAVWYEYYRDNNLEPRRNTLPDWRKFGSTSILSTSVCFFINRFRSWGRDVFTTSMPDDISRHVYAPVLDNKSSVTTVLASDSSTDYLNAETQPGVQFFNTNRNIVEQSLNYRDPVTNSEVTITCPLPARVNDIITANSTTKKPSNHLLDLFTLRNAKSLERYLKRNFYFGDEYNDRMLAHYGSYVSDMRINRPEFLSSSVQPINPNQVVSSAGTDVTPQGERNMTVTASTGDDTYNFTAEEFGIVLNIISVMPVAQYAGICPQNMLSKVVDYPIPEFAANNEEFSRVYEIAFSGLAKNGEHINPCFAHHPYAHAWRSRVNEVHKEYLSDLQEYTFRRFFGMDDASSVPILNASFIHCKPNLGMFVAGHDRLFTPQVYGCINHSYYCESVLPTPVEVI